MRDEQIAGNNSINAVIARCFTYIDKEDERRFLRRFREQPHDQDRILHTFRELILGAFLGFNHLRVKNEYRIGGKTPDWCILDSNSSISCVVELVNFHVDSHTEETIDTELRNKKSVFYLTGANERRLYYNIQNKITTYKKVVESFGVPYVVAVFGDFKANVDITELRSCLFGDTSGLFLLYPDVSGILFFEECSGKYQFLYIQNLQAKRAIELPHGMF